MQETQFQSLGQEDPLEKRMAAHSCLKNSMVREARQVTVHGDAESDTTEQLTLVCICVCVSVSLCVCVYKEIEKTLLETQMCCSEIKDWGEIWNYPKIPT